MQDVLPVSIEITDFEQIRLDMAEEYLSQEQHYPWVVAFSGGKDSTLVAHFFFEMLLDLPPSLRKRPIFFVSIRGNN